MLPLRTPTLPPATHTNTSFVGGECYWIVDPATPNDQERTKLIDAIMSLRAEGRRALGIVLTHHHNDHIGAVAWLREQLKIPIFAHPLTKDLLGGKIDVHIELEEGDTLRGSKSLKDLWQVLHTPGHASGHIVLWNENLGILVAGDMVASEGTILVEPPDGHMATYIQQLKRLRQLRPDLIVPAHGEVITKPVDLLDHYISHRLSREAKIASRLTRAEQSLSEVTAASYDDVPASLHRLAEGSTHAHLIKLEEEGRAVSTPENRWRTVLEA